MKDNRLLLLGVIMVLLALSIGRAASDSDGRLDINIPEPSPNVSEKIKNISNIVTETEDKKKLCAFNKVFADRLILYNANQQELNDVYVLAAKKYFGTSLKDKYDGLDSILKNAMLDVVGDDVHNIGPEEKKELQENFYAIAWYLNN
jgi:hypothetical protein